MVPGTQKSAFTLIELLVVIAIIGILAALLLPGLARAKEQGRTARCIGNVRQMGLALTMYVDDHGSYPPSLYQPLDENLWISWYESLAPYLAKWTNGNTVFRCPSFRFRHADTVGLTVPFDSGVGSYGYNSDSPFALSPASVWMGSRGNPIRTAVGSRHSIRESQVAAPSQMIALGDSYLVERQPEKIMEGVILLQYIPDKFRSRLAGYQHEQQEVNRRHNGKHEIAFCDGHVEGIKYKRLFADDPEAQRIWNYDHEPHPTPYD